MTLVLDSVRVIKKHLENETLQNEKREHTHKQREVVDNQRIQEIQHKHQLFLKQTREELQQKLSNPNSA